METISVYLDPVLLDRATSICETRPRDELSTGLRAVAFTLG